MLEMLKERKAALEAQGKKGFTLMEMLIVIAIIAVLIAIAIPVFTAQLERANEGVDAANIRSAYAEAMSDALSNGTNSATKETAEKMKSSSWEKLADAETLGGVAIADIPKEEGKTVKVTVTDGVAAFSVGS